MKKHVKKTCFSVVGPTAMGKTARALEMAHQLLKEKKVVGVDIISADSRQVYRGLEILTGADLPEGFGGGSIQSQSKSEICYFANTDESIRIFGISMIKPTEEWSLAHFVTFAREVMQSSWSNNRQPILVGGTGLYHKHLFSDDATPQISQDLAIREKAKTMSVEDLQRWLDQVDSGKLLQLNKSDRENPRRLIRSIEVASWQKKRENSSLLEIKTSNSPLVWSKVENGVELLTAPLEIIKERIEKRVAKRFASGAIKEVQKLLDLHLPSSALVLTTLGVPEIVQYLEGSLSAEACQQLWSLHEFQYAKRQITWWKKETTTKFTAHE